jgi:hypothetical protein
MLMLASSRFVGVADIAAVRFSLPSQLLEPIPNLGMLEGSRRDEADRFCQSIGII